VARLATQTGAYVPTSSRVGRDRSSRIGYNYRQERGIMTTKRSDETKSSAAAPRSPRRKAAAKTAASQATPETAAVPRARKRAEAARDAMPKAQAAAKGTPAQHRQPTHQEIAARAREIWHETGGNAFENWIRAERELKK
jgi:hypothetical protein